MPLVLTADTNPGTAAFSAFAGSIYAAGLITVDQAVGNVAAVAVAGLLATDVIVATLKSDDTGSTLGPLLTATKAPSSAHLNIKFTNPPTNDDGVVNYMIIRPD
jgi:hypothetical protein